MNTLIDQLVEASYVEGVLNADTVARIADRLNRKQLKAYIHALKAYVKKNTVYVEVPAENAIMADEVFQTIFGNKQVTYQVNPDLLLGLRIRDNDDVYNMNIKATLERITAYAAE